MLEKRADGYHDIESVFVEIPCHDIIEIIEDETEQFTTSGLPVSTNDNLVIRAKQLFAQHVHLPILSIHLHKAIPMGAGLGGGSSDAAFVLKLLRNHYAPSITDQSLEKMASELGSDCAFFIKGGTQLASGRGEKLNFIQLDLSAYYLILVNDGTHISTQEAYAGVVPNNIRTSIQVVVSQPIETWKDTLVNDFEASVFQQHPQLADIKANLYAHGAIYAAMSGSGSTIFALFDHKPPSINWKTPMPFSTVIALKQQ